MLYVTLADGKVRRHPDAAMALANKEQGCWILYGHPDDAGDMNAIAWYPSTVVLCVEAEIAAHGEAAGENVVEFKRPDKKDGDGGAA
jgi:hypothetical protein